MAIASLNVNGLRRHFDEVQCMLVDLDINILALNETKLDGMYPNELTNIPGYQHVRHDRSCRGGGISIYIRDSINFKLRSDIPAEELELICIEIEPPKSKSFIVLAWYKPPSDLVSVFNRLEIAISYLDRENKELLLLGDTNCDLSNRLAGLSTEGNARHMCNLYELFSFTQLIEEPTRVRLSSSTIIDHIATTCPRKIVEAEVRKISFLSDHYMVYCTRKQNGSITKDHKMIKTRQMNNFIEGEFLADVVSVCWEHVVTVSDNINSLVNDWSAIFSALIEKHAPLREMRASEKYCPWIDRDLKNLMRTRDKLKRATIKRESPILMNSYRQTRNRVNLVHKQLKKQHYTNKISSNKGNLKDS